MLQSYFFGLLTHNISSDPSRLWDPQRLVRPFETLGTATSRRTLRDSGNRNADNFGASRNLYWLIGYRSDAITQ
jgi:hypothetical protein